MKNSPGDRHFRRSRYCFANQSHPLDPAHPDGISLGANPICVDSPSFNSQA
ncbi:hypothetical protein [Phormidium sp. CCY1219]|uniref:hypothetical protein n=1 Tax=Phormidium sp. CCY1219 TaxID=2886104 RepID=UPI002D1EBCC2|nr:hypothetical protein [Phormidium sp. CCY1219]MEB3827829.1 hypothetical protein [Phormidium sp. CCY1219]